MWNWPATRFEVMFQRYQIRRQRDLLRSARDDMIAAVYSNPTFDKMKDPAKAREKAIEAIEESYCESVEILYGLRGDRSNDKDEVVEAMKQDPFFRRAFSNMNDLANQDTRIRYEQDGLGRAVLE